MLKKFLPELYIINKLISLKLKGIDDVKIDCFHSDDLGRFYSFRTYNHQREDIANLIKSVVKNNEPTNVKFDLRKLTNVISSKSLSWGYSFDTMYSFGRNLVNAVGLVNIHNDKTFSSIENCFQDMRCNDEFVFRIDHVLWENRYIWLNDGGSHHCATAIFYAENQHKELLVNASFRIQSLDKKAINEINGKYKIFVVSSKKYYELQKLISPYKPIFLEALQSQNMLLVFEKNNQLPNKIIRFLETYDQRYILDFNNHISNLLKKQLEVEGLHE
ncbi:MAG: hypothetical protein EOM50_18380 [Erysipelotrichia bacterium]|nr:hypothetical protein [Erysipelotrichia bacterium]